jgi:hypothetical protein
MRYNFKHKLHLDVTDRGFTLWNDVDKRWIVDASCLNDDLEITIGSHIIKTDEGRNGGGPIFLARSKIRKVKPTASNKRSTARKARPKSAKRRLRTA